MNSPLCEEQVHATKPSFLGQPCRSFCIIFDLRSKLVIFQLSDLEHVDHLVGLGQQLVGPPAPELLEAHRREALPELDLLLVKVGDAVLQLAHLERLQRRDLLLGLLQGIRKSCYSAVN